MENEELDFNQLTEQIPDDWCRDDELNEIAEGIMEDLKESMSQSINDVASLINCSPDEIMETLAEASRIYGRMALFEDKYDHIVEAFPIDSDGERNYPDKILAKIFGTSVEEAIEIFQNNFGLKDTDKLSDIIVND